MVSDKTELKTSDSWRDKRILKNLEEDKTDRLKFVGVMLPVEMYRELESIAREEDRRVSQIIRLAIRRYLKEKRDAEVKE